MTNRSKRKADETSREISWKRVRAIFDNPKPPEHIWQRPFDELELVPRHFLRGHGKARQ